MAWPTRLAVLPGVPTFDELKLPAMSNTSWYGIVAPAKTPAPIVARLNHEIAVMLESPELATYLTNEGALAKRSSPEEFRAYIKSEIARWRKVITDAGIPRAS